MSGLFNEIYDFITMVTKINEIQQNLAIFNPSTYQIFENSAKICEFATHECTNITENPTLCYNGTCPIDIFTE